MGEFVLKVKWLWRLARSHNYIVITEREAIIAIPAGDQPESIDDVFVLANQEAALKEFQDNMNALIARHEDRFKLLVGTEKEVKKERTIARKAAVSRSKAKSNHTK